MFYTYADKLGTGFFGSWQTRQVAFDTLHRYLYYSEPTCDASLKADSSASKSTPASPRSPQTATRASGGAPNLSVTDTAPARASFSAETDASEVSVDPTAVVWRNKIKVTAVLPIATTPYFNPNRCANERDLYRLEIRGESRPMKSGEAPPAEPLLCPAAGLSSLERSRCNVHNEAFIRDPFFLKELFDSLRDQFDELAKERLRAAAREQAEAGSGEDGSGGGDSAGAAGVSSAPAMTGVQTLTSPRSPKGGMLRHGSAYQVRLFFRARDEREFRRLWFVLQSVLGYDKLIVRPYRGLPPYDPRNGVAFAHIPMSVWHTFASLDKAVFYTFTRGNVYALENEPTPAAAAASHEAAQRNIMASAPTLKCILAGAYLCVTHDSVLCMRDTGNIPRWLRLAEVQEFHWDLAATDPVTHAATPFCVFLSDSPIPDLFFEPLPPVHVAGAIGAYTPLVDVRRLASVMHDSCFASLSTRRVIRMREVQDASMDAYVTRTLQEGRRPPITQNPGMSYNSTLSCPLPKEQLAVVWQQVQAELLDRGNMANRAAIPIYANNARDVELSEDQLSTVERKLDEEREQHDDIVGMPLERARQLERTPAQAGATERNARGGRARKPRRHRSRQQHTDPVANEATSASLFSNASRTDMPPPPAQSTAPLVMPLTLELLQTPQLQGRFAFTGGAAAGTPPTGQHGVPRDVDPELGSVHSSSRSFSTVVASEYSGYLVPGSRYISHEEWNSAGYATANAGAAAAVEERVSTAAPTSGAGAAHNAPVSNPGRRAASAAGADGESGSKVSQRYADERTVNEIVGRSMAALDGSRNDLSQLDR